MVNNRVPNLGRPKLGTHSNCIERNATSFESLNILMLSLFFHVVSSCLYLNKQFLYHANGNFQSSKTFAYTILWIFSILAIAFQKLSWQWGKCLENIAGR